MVNKVKYRCILFKESCGMVTGVSASAYPASAKYFLIETICVFLTFLSTNKSSSPVIKCEALLSIARANKKSSFESLERVNFVRTLTSLP